MFAWHVAGTVYCDANNNGQIDAADTKRGGVTVRATALDSSAGTKFSGNTASGTGAYSIAVFDTPNRYTMAITAGLPAGAVVTIPSGGTGTAVLTNSITQIDNFNFLVANNCNPPPQCTTASQCDDGNVCTTDTCNSGSCVHTNNTASCDDGNACTTGDVCSSGTCHAGSATSCDDGNVCTTDSCNTSTGCVHTNNTASCDDGNACTTGDVCSGGSCHGGAAKSCDDGNLCTTDSCNTSTGCVHTNNTASCDDGNACTTGDVCSGGSCHAGSPKSCDDGNVCTTDSCNTSTGCVHTNNTASCDDGNACTTGDVCSGGTCHTGSAKNCDDNNFCTTDSCNPSTGCVHANNSLPCDDGTACTTGDACTNGACTGTPIACNDGNPCNGTETCDPQTGVCTLGVPPFLLRKGGRINNEATIEVDLAANDVRGQLRFGHAVNIADGTTVTADQIKLGAGSSLFNVNTFKLFLSRGASVRGTQGLPVLPVATPFCPITQPFPACNPSNPVTVAAADVVGPLPPGVYGDLNVARSGILFLLPGDYVFCSVGTGTFADIQVWGPGHSTIKVVGTFQIADSSTLEAVRGADFPTVEVEGKLVRIGEQGRLFSILSAPNALIKLGRSAELHGSICADKVNTDKNTLFACP